MTNICITSYSAICNLGSDIKEIFSNAIKGTNDFLTEDSQIIKGQSFFLGKVTKTLPTITDPIYNTRTNALLLHCYKQIQDQIEKLKTIYGKNRIAIIVGTTNTGVKEYEHSKNILHTQIGLPAQFLKEHIGLNNFHCGISTACTSGLKVFSTGIKLLKNNICDAIICASTDALTATPIFGFNSLEVLSHKKCIPFSKNRNGINIGEGAALFILEKNAKNGTEILSLGETSDAYHSATPDPQGKQAIIAIENALKQANLNPSDIDYINLHGTGTISNDLMESNAIWQIFNDKTPCSSTKGQTGHCLGASAGIETALCLAFLDKNLNPNKVLLPHIYDNNYDPQLPKIRLTKQNETAPKAQYALCNAFGFGGSNAVMLLGNKQND